MKGYKSSAAAFARPAARLMLRQDGRAAARPTRRNSPKMKKIREARLALPRQCGPTDSVERRMIARLWPATPAPVKALQATNMA